jgi:hypothetical protein
MALCIAHHADGRLCRAPASILDPQRGGLVCREHVPLAIAAAISQAEASGSAHADLEHRGRRYLWRVRRDDEVGQRYLRRLEGPERREGDPRC